MTDWSGQPIRRGSDNHCASKQPCRPLNTTRDLRRFLLAVPGAVPSYFGWNLMPPSKRTVSEFM
jgi:hypothetical protein